MASGKIPAKPGLVSFFGKNKLPGSSIKKPTTSAFHQFGDSISQTKNGERSGKIYGSINSALKNKRPSDLNKKKDERLDLLSGAGNERD